MRADGVVEDLQIGKNICVRSCARGILLQMDELVFQTAEEVLGNSVVVGIAPAGHALPDVIGFQLLLVGSGCVLNAAVAVEDQARRRLASAVSLFSSSFPFLLPLSFPCYDCLLCLSIRVWGHRI